MGYVLRGQGHAANLNIGESYVNITNTGANSGRFGQRGAFSMSGNICANVYTFDQNEQMISCCSCLVTPDQTVSLGVVRDLISSALIPAAPNSTPAIPNSVTIKLLSTLAGGAGNNCLNSAANVANATLVTGMGAWGTTLHALTATSPVTYFGTETAFTPATLSATELNTLATQCTAFAGSGVGICNSCRAGAQ